MSRPTPVAPLIRFEDTHLVVLSKPAGLLSQGDDSGEENLVDLLREYFGRNYVGLVHRLDRNTSGLMVVAKRSKSAERLTRALQSGTLTREYRALVRGDLRGTHRWTDWLVKDEARNETRVVPAPVSAAKEAVLQLSALAPARAHRGQPVTWVELKLETGRSHQIRVQCAARHYPLLGDPKYGLGDELDRALGRPALHSFRLSFPHPMSQETLSFEEPAPADLRPYL